MEAASGRACPGTADQRANLFSNPLQMKLETSPKAPKYQNPLTDEKSRAPRAGQPNAPKRGGPLSPGGVSAILSRRRGAEGSRLANESKSRSSTARGDVGPAGGSTAAGDTGREELQGLGALGEGAQKVAKWNKKKKK